MQSLFNKSIYFFFYVVFISYTLPSYVTEQSMRTLRLRLAYLAWDIQGRGLKISQKKEISL